MNRPILLITFGLLLQATVFVLPFTPYPLVRMVFDRDALAIERGYKKFLESGIWVEGDPGFKLMQFRFMEDVARGGIQGFLEDEIIGESLVAFQIGESETPAATPETQPVYVVFSNNRGQIVKGDFVKLTYVRFQKNHAAAVNLALLIAGSVAIYAGLARLFTESTRMAMGDAQDSAAGNSLSPAARS